MRLWSLHPKYLDRIGLVALWRESLLAQSVLRGHSTGYRNHPQLIRFRNHHQSERAIADYLTEVWREATRRGYAFDEGRIGTGGAAGKISVTTGQLTYELDLLYERLKKRDRARYRKMRSAKEQEIQCHPLFEKVRGPIEAWEKGNARVGG